MHEYDMALEMAYGRSRDLRQAAQRARLVKSCARPGHPWLRGMAWAGGLLIALGHELQQPARRAGEPTGPLRALYRCAPGHPGEPRAG